MKQFMRIMPPNYITSRRVLYSSPDPEVCSQFANDCIQQISALDIATSAGFFDENGKAWTLCRKRFSENYNEIYVKCVEKNMVKVAWIYPATQQLCGDEKGFPVPVNDWVVQVVC
jgi:hypothetical protein